MYIENESEEASLKAESYSEPHPPFITHIQCATDEVDVDISGSVVDNIKC